MSRHPRLLPVWALAVAGFAVHALAGGLLADRGDDAAVGAVVIDLNRASPDDLQALPGVGAVRAEAIVLDRVRVGPFRAVADLDRVDGLGSGTVAALRPFVSVGAGDRAASPR